MSNKRDERKARQHLVILEEHREVAQDSPFPEEYRHMPAKDRETDRWLPETNEQMWWTFCWQWMMIGNHLLIQRTLGLLPARVLE